MQFINKKDPIYQQKGRKIVDKFIKESWDKVARKYVNLDFEGLKRDTIIKQVLFEEQSGFCCYCMRKTETPTIEHIIPESANNADDYREFDILKKDVISIGFEKTEEMKTPPFPHIIAYENLTMSCNGDIVNTSSGNVIKNQCCNHSRGTKKIVPVFFKKDVLGSISYAKDGTLVFVDDNLKETIKAVNLSNDLLVKIRNFWAKISNSTYHIQDVISAISNKTIRENIIDECLKNVKDEILFKENDKFWKLFSEYEWFYNYYKNLNKNK